MAKSHSVPGPLKPLPPSALRRLSDVKALGFRTTDDLECVNHLIGQDRAMKAIAFGSKIKKQGFNLFALGPAGSGRHSSVRSFLDGHAATEPKADDWIYVNNFDAPHRPTAIRLPSGHARRLRDGMGDLIDDLSAALPTLFESDEYQGRRRAIDQQFEEAQEKAFEELQKRASDESISIMRTPMGFALAPTHDGKPIKPEVFKTLPKAQREHVEKTIQELQAELARVLQQMPKLEKQRREQTRNLDMEFAETVVGTAVSDLISTFKDHRDVTKYLESVRQDLIENAFLFLPQAVEGETGQAVAVGAPGRNAPQFRRYGINVVVANGDGIDGAPVITEDLPTIANLIGRIEHVSQMGALVTDFMLIKPGALHRANGGYLILDARRVLSDGLGWNALKRSLTADCIKITSAAEQFGMAGTVSLEPDPIPLTIKVVLIGDRQLYHLVHQHDPDFSELFKVEADFDEVIIRSDDNTCMYARLVATIAQRESLKPLEAKAVARIIDESSRNADDAERLSLRVGQMADILREADFWAGEDKARRINVHHINRALEERHERSARIRERSLEYITRETILIDTDDEVVGQINGLSVLQLGNMSFGKPTRISARVRLGTGKVVDIEREVELGGPLHSKGVLILSSYLASHFAKDFPMSLGASLVFEQSYGGVDGDSASSTELYALLSALSGVAIRQGLAVTGSVNQFGQVQAIGGVNEKIEGYFDICAARGLTGSQGVLIPVSNVKNLMLRPDIQDAARKKQFQVYAIETIDQGIEVLTGVAAGARRSDGTFPDGTINALVEAQLRAFAETRRDFAKSGANGKDSDEH